MSERMTAYAPPDPPEGAPQAIDPAYRALFSAIREAVFVVNAETGSIVDANPAAEALTGRSLRDMRELHHSQLHPSDEAEKALRRFAAVTGRTSAGGGNEDLGDWTILHRDGSRIPVDILASPWSGREGPPLVFGIFREISERTAAASVLRRSEERFRQLAELAGEFMWEVDTDGLYTYAGPMLEQILGYKPEDVVGKLHFYDLFVPESREEMKNAAFALFGRREAFRDFPNLNVRRDGALVALETTGFPIYDSGGTFVGYRGADRDVTERQRANALLRAVMDNSPNPIFVKDRASRLLLANPATLTAFGKTADDVLGKTDEEIYGDPAAGRKIMANDCLVMDTGQTRSVEEVVPSPGGPRIYLSAKVPYRDAQGKVIGLIGIAHDITERKRADEAVRDSELKYRRLYESISDAVVTVDMSGRILEFNRTYEAMLGYTGEELRGLTYPQITPEPWHALEARIVQEEVLRDGYSNVYEKEYRRKDGTVVPVELRTYLLRGENNMPAGMWAIVRDISERKRVDQALRDSERRFRSLFDNSLDGVFLTDSSGSIEAANPAACALFGMTEEEICRAGRKGLTVDDERLRAALDTRQSTGRVQSELTYIRKDGTRFDGDFRSALLDEDGHAFVVIHDITKRKRAAEALRLSEEKFAAIFRCSPVSITLSDLNDGDRFIEVNEAFEKYTGHARETVIGRVYPPDWLWADAGEYADAVAQLTRNGRLQNHEFRFRTATGEIRNGILYAEPVQVNNRTCVLATTVDVTERRRAEEALRQSEQCFRGIFENATVGMYRTTPAGAIEMANPALVRMLGYQSFAALAQRNLEESGFEPQYSRSDFCRRLEQDGEIHGLESSWKRRDGSMLFVRESARCMRDATGAVRFYEGIVEDISDRKRMEDALRESEQKFATAFRLGPAALSIVDTEDGNRIIDLNEGFEQASGYSRAELLGERAKRLGIWPNAGEWAQAQQQFVESGRLRNFEFSFRKKNGEVGVGLLSAESVEVKGRRCAITCTIDITERKRAEAALVGSEARLRHAQRLAHVGSWEMDALTGKLRWSDEMFRIFGLPLADAPEFATFVSYLHPKDRDKIADAQRRALDASGPAETQFRIIRPDGSVRVIRSIVEGIRDEQGGVAGFRGATQDVTEQVNATEMLRDSERRLSTAERIAHVGNWRWEIETKRVFWSEELFRILGIPEHCTPNFETFVERVTSRDRERVAQWVENCLKGRGEHSLEFQIARPDGEQRTVVSVIEVTVDEDASPVHVSGTCQDVTEDRRARIESFARQKLESLGTLASGIAHDFNNLLGAVLAQAELAEAELDAGSAPHEELKKIRDVAIRGSDIVRQLLIYAGKDRDVVEPVDISSTVKEMLGLLKATVSKHATLVTDLSEALPAVRARAAQIRQILMNLVVNASDAIKDSDGVIRVTTGRATLAPDVAGAAQEGLAEGDYVQLGVSDTGCGMSDETQARIFDPFFSTKSTGRGLGLPVVHGIIRNLGGAIRVSTERGKGTRFEILLPCAGAPAQRAAGTAGRIDEPFRQPATATVLLVEDEAALRSAVSKMLGRAGFRVLEAADGSEALALLRNKAGEIDVLFLDVTIPGAPSHEVFAEAVRARAEMKVILTSAYSEEMVKSTVSGPQVCGFVRKPFQLGTVVETLRKALLS